VGSEVPVPDPDGSDSGTDGSGYPNAERVERSRSDGAERAGRPCASALFDPAEVVGVFVSEISEGEASDQTVQELPEIEAEPYWGNHFWVRGHTVNTVGMNEEVIRRYVKYQEKREKEEEQNRRRFDLFEG